MPTTAEDFLLDDCWGPALRYAIAKNYLGDISAIRQAMQQAGIDKLAELAERNTNQAELFVEQTCMGDWLAQTEDGIAQLGNTRDEAIQNLREKMA